MRDPGGWRPLIHELAAARATRGSIGCWCWQHRVGSVLWLRPAYRARSPVLALVVDSMAPVPPKSRAELDAWRERKFDEVPCCRARIRWVDAVLREDEAVLQCADALKHVDPARFDDVGWLAAPLAASMWDHTLELPEVPGLRLPMPTRSVAELRRAGYGRIAPLDRPAETERAWRQAGLLDPEPPAVRVVEHDESVLGRKRKQLGWEF